MVSLTDISVRLGSVMIGITHIQIDVDKIYTYLFTMATHSMSPLLCPPLTDREILENIMRYGTTPSVSFAKWCQLRYMELL